MESETEESKIESLHDFALKLMDFHGGQNSATYSVASCMLADYDRWPDAVDACVKELKAFAKDTGIGWLALCPDDRLDGQPRSGTHYTEDGKLALQLADQLIVHRDHKLRLDKLDDLTMGYLIGICFTTDDDAGGGEYGDNGRGQPLLETLSQDDLDGAIADCKAFQEKGAKLLEEAYNRPGYNAERAGHDFHFSRNRHGVGFWDRPELDEDGLGDKLDELAKSFGEIWPSIEDGKLSL